MSRCAPEIHLGTVTVQETARIFEIPSISHPLTASLGSEVELLGYDLSTDTATPGGTLTLTLYWRALAEMAEDYTVFTHLLASDGSMSGQRDGHPVGGTYPTSLWWPGEIVADVHDIPIHADVTPGTHQLEVGMYVTETGARLAVDGLSGDAVLLQSIEVTAPDLTTQPDLLPRGRPTSAGSQRTQPLLAHSLSPSVF
jgi:hypothetical protein